MAAEIPASTLEGAMVQIMLAHSAADLMAADSADETAVVQMRTISKLLYSALTVLERVAGVSREELAENVVADLVGHEKTTMTYGLYSGGVSLAVKRELLDKLIY